MELTAGDRIADKFLVERVIGEGGMGIVYLVRHQVLKERFAVKVLRPEAAASPEAVTRFVNEARAAVRVKNEHIATVMDVGRLPDGSAYMVMEYLEGTDLARLLEDKGPLPAADVVDYVLQALEGLAHAHAEGIVHRDLKPGNLFLANLRGGGTTIKVLDFGVSKLTADLLAEQSRERVTATKAMLGSPGYMSPEQVRSSHDVDPRSDLWSVGVILYRLLTGVAPFDADTLGGILAAILETTPPPITTVRPELPGGLVRVIERCLAKAPRARWKDASELAEALAPFAPAGAAARVDHIRRLLGVATPPARAPEQATAAARQAEPSEVPAVAQASLPAEPRTPAKRSLSGARVALVVLAAVVFAAAGGGVVLVVTRSRTPTSCAELASRKGGLADGLYTVDPDGASGPLEPFQVYCVGLGTSEPKDYLPLEHTAPFFPSSNYTRVEGGRCGGSGPPCGALVRHFEKVRIQVAELAIDTGNLTFAEAEDPKALDCWRQQAGGACATYATTHYGTANDCVMGAEGSANIDLRGTPFAIDPSVTYSTTGYEADGGVSFDRDRTTADVTGGGYCGSTEIVGPLLLKQR